MNIDVGCGGGRFTADPRTLDVTCDIDKAHIPNFIQCDAHHLPFQSNVFDIAFCCNVLEHVKQPLTVFRELRRISKSQIIVQDRMYSLYSYATTDHLWFQMPMLKFLPYPRTRIGIFFGNYLHHILSFKIQWRKGSTFALVSLLNKLSNITNPRYEVIID